jgi:hypothetical protein
VAESGLVTEPGFGVIVNSILFNTLVSLTAKVNLLMKGVGPAVWPVIVIVVSSASLEPAKWEKAMKMAPMMITEYVFIGLVFCAFVKRLAPGCQRRPCQVQQKLQ